VEIELDTYAEISHFDSYFVPIRSEPDYHEMISLQSSSQAIVSHQFSLLNNLSSTDEKVHSITSKRISMKLMKMEGSGEMGGKWSWGGKSGPEFSGYANVEVQDKKGNYAKVEAQQNSDGTGSVAACGGHRKK